MLKKTKQPICTIKGKPIPGSIYGKLCKALGEYGAGKALYKARKASNPVKYLLAGLRAGWIGESTVEQDYNKTAMENWISKNIHRQAPAPKVKVKPTKWKYKTVNGKKILVEKISGRTAEPDSIQALIKDIL